MILKDIDTYEQISARKYNILLKTAMLVTDVYIAPEHIVTGVIFIKFTNEVVMGNLWVLFIVIYALLKGSREGMKKAALKKSSSSEILFYYTLIAWILCLPFSQNAFKLDGIYIFYSFLKDL